MHYISIILIGFVMSLSASAHGPTPKKAEESITINAPVDKVWDIVKDYGNISMWHPGVKSSSGINGNEPGKAERTITLQNDGQLKEGLDDYNTTDHKYEYRLAKENIEAFPVSSYSARLEVKPAENGCVVEWIGRYYRADTSNEPAPEKSDEAAEKAMTEFIRTGLENLKKLAEQ